MGTYSFRSDAVQPAGPFFLKDLMTILPMIDPLVLLEITGMWIHEEIYEYCEIYANNINYFFLGKTINY